MKSVKGLQGCVALLLFFIMPAAKAQHQAAAAKKWITVSGKIQFQNPAPYQRFNKIWLSKKIGGRYKLVDSFALKEDGHYHFRVDATIPSLYHLDIVKFNSVNFFSDADVVINDRGYDTAKIKIKNPPYVFIQSKSINNQIINMIDHIDYEGYQEMIALSREQYFAGQHKDEDSAWASYLKKEDLMGKFNERQQASVEVLIRSFSGYPGVLEALNYINWKKRSDYVLGILDNLLKKYPWLQNARDMKNDIHTYLVRSKMLENGKPAPLFSYPTSDGGKVSLASLRGKYVLIDFWASWCGPCRKAIPKVKKLYEAYRDKGFTVLSVSIDDSKVAWREAMKEENMPWAQTLSPDKEKTMTDYMFSAIPTMYLLDRDGKIVDKYTGYSEELEARLKGIFGS